MAEREKSQVSSVITSQDQLLRQEAYKLENKRLGTDSHEYSGFYYDIQLQDPRTRVSLHPNTAVVEYVKNIDQNKTHAFVPRWARIRSEGTPHRAVQHGNTKAFLKIFHPEDEEDRDPVTYEGVGEDGKTKMDLNYPYAKEAICTSILKEDFKLSVNNQFTEMGGDPLSSFFNQQKSSLPLINAMGDFLKGVTKKTDEMVKQRKEEGLESGWIGTMAKVLKGFEGAGKLQTTLMNRALVVQGTRFSFYAGTSVNPENLTMDFTIFPTWELKRDRIEFLSVYDQLDTLMPYIIGDFVPVNFGGFESEADDSKLVAVAKDAANELSKIATEFASWQLPPGGFEAYPKDVDIVQKGTLKLRIGTLFALENLVIINCNFTMSKQLIKDPVSPLNVTPAYCDITLSLKPVTKYSKNSLLRFLKGKANVTDRNTTSMNMLQGLSLSQQYLNRQAYVPGAWRSWLNDAGVRQKEPTYTIGQDLSQEPEKGSGKRGRKRKGKRGSSKRKGTKKTGTKKKK